MIVKDEEQTLARCLSCVKSFADEIVIVDTGSSDKTVEIAQGFTDKIYYFEWVDDFAAARNFSFEKATCPLVMWLDADDIVTEENSEKIIKLKEEMGDVDVAYLKYVAFDGDRAALSYYRERIFKRSKNFKWCGAVHEVIVPSGNVLYSNAEIHHKKVKENAPLRNLIIYQKQIARGISLDERQKFYYGRELFFNKMYLQCTAVLEDFLLGNGWVENKIEACRQLFFSYAYLGDKRRALASLFRALSYTSPRPQDLCALGEYFLNMADYDAAIFWYKAALYADVNEEGGGFYNPDYSGFVPYMQLCVAYDRKGDHKEAEKYNRLAGEIKPDDERYLYNKRYFERLFKRSGDKQL